VGDVKAVSTGFWKWLSTTTEPTAITTIARHDIMKLRMPNSSQIWRQAMDIYERAIRKIKWLKV
jgi:hypothetical protein